MPRSRMTWVSTSAYSMASNASSIQPREAASKVRRCSVVACRRSWIGPMGMRGAIVAGEWGCWTEDHVRPRFYPPNWASTMLVHEQHSNVNIAFECSMVVEGVARYFYRSRFAVGRTSWRTHVADVELRATVRRDAWEPLSASA